SGVLVLLGVIVAQVLFRPIGRWKVDSVFAVWVLLPGFIVGMAFLAWVTVVPGWTAVLSAYDVQSGVPGGIGLAAFYWHFVAGAKLLPIALMLSIGAILLRVTGASRPVLFTGSALALALWAGEHGPPGIEPTEGRYAG